MSNLIENNQFMGGKVFLAVRPGLFKFNDPELTSNQHVTMEYIGTLPFPWDLMEKVDEWEKKLGLTENVQCLVKVNGYANWYNSNNDKERYFDVALVEFPWCKDIGWEKNWHVTLGKSDKPVLPRQFDPSIDGERIDYISDLWIGFKEKDGASKWLSATAFRDMYRQWDKQQAERQEAN